MKTIFLVSGLLAGSLGFVILFSADPTQEIQGLMLFLIGTVFLSVVVIMQSVAGAQKEMCVLLEQLVEAAQQRREDFSGGAKKAKPEPQAEPQADSETESQVA